MCFLLVGSGRNSPPDLMRSKPFHLLLALSYAFTTLLLSLCAYASPLNLPPLSARLSSSAESWNPGYSFALPSRSNKQRCPVVLKPQAPQSSRSTSRLLHKIETKTYPVSSNMSITKASSLSSSPSKTSVFEKGLSGASRSDARPRIVNGQVANEDLALSLVRIETDTGMCSGTLVSSNTVITAAHCDVTEYSYAYVGGTSQRDSGELMIVSEVYTSNDYDRDPEGTTQKYDFSIVELSFDVPSWARPMKVNSNASVPQPGSFARIAGYGNLREDDESNNEDLTLYQVDVPITSGSDCVDIYAKGDILIDEKFQICAGYERGGCDSCHGDNGGPIFQYDDQDEPVLIGVVSFGVGCARPGFPGVYVRTSPYESVFKTYGIQESKNAVAVYAEQPSQVGKYVGSAVAVIVIVGFAVGAVIFITKRRKRQNDSPVRLAGISPPPPPPEAALTAPPPAVHSPSTPQPPPPPPPGEAMTAPSPAANAQSTPPPLQPMASPGDELPNPATNYPVGTDVPSYTPEQGIQSNIFGGYQPPPPYQGVNPVIPAPSAVPVPNTPPQVSYPAAWGGSANTNAAAAPPPQPSSSSPPPSQSSTAPSSYPSNWGAPPTQSPSTAQPATQPAPSSPPEGNRAG